MKTSLILLVFFYSLVEKTNCQNTAVVSPSLYYLHDQARHVLCPQKNLASKRYTQINKHELSCICYLGLNQLVLKYLSLLELFLNYEICFQLNLSLLFILQQCTLTDARNILLRNMQIFEILYKNCMSVTTLLQFQEHRTPLFLKKLNYWSDLRFFQWCYYTLL